jgi:hypothetical protein
MSTTPLPPLEKLDPAASWQSFVPDAQQPWDLKWAGHLYRRAGFGANLSELRQAVKRGLPATLDLLLHGAPDAAARESFLVGLGDSTLNEEDAGKLRAWWVYCMLFTKHPLHEKMTLFWHNHFATSIAKVQRVPLMYNQNKLLRQHALGTFRPLLMGISHDPAMLVWLDSNSNVKGKANENYARELMELFSLGVGNYSETDVREAARAFTGWHTDDDKFDFNPLFHDDGEKTVLKQTGKWDGNEIVRIVLEQPAAAQFLVRKLYHFFVNETVTPPAAFLEPLASAFRKSDFDIASLVGTILGSRHFFSGHAYRQRIKGPAEFVVGTIHALNEGTKVSARPAALANRLEAMGQQLFAPPNVKGWVGGRSWLNTATVLARHNFAQLVVSRNLAGDSFAPTEENTGAVALALEVPPAPSPPGGAPANAAKKPDPPAEYHPDPALDPAGVVRREKVTDPAGAARVLIELHLQGDVSDAARSKIVAFLAEGKPQGKLFDQRVREASHALMTMPEYQLA